MAVDSTTGDSCECGGMSSAPFDEIRIVSLKIQVILGGGDPIALQLMTVPVELEKQLYEAAQSPIWAVALPLHSCLSRCL